MVFLVWVRHSPAAQKGSAQKRRQALRADDVFPVDAQVDLPRFMAKGMQQEIPLIVPLHRNGKGIPIFLPAGDGAPQVHNDARHLRCKLCHPMSNGGISVTMQTEAREKLLPNKSKP